jgi:hypothetical protein
MSLAGFLGLEAAYITTLEHLAGDVLDALLVCRLGATMVLAHGIHECQIRLEELDVAPIRQARVFILGNLDRRVIVAAAEAVEEGTAEVCCVGDICHLVQGCGQTGEMDEVLKPGEVKVVEALLNGQLPKRLSICPDVLVGDTEEI